MLVAGKVHGGHTEDRSAGQNSERYEWNASLIDSRDDEIEDRGGEHNPARKCPAESRQGVGGIRAQRQKAMHQAR